jgi:hypothetical protein
MRYLLASSSGYGGRQGVESSRLAVLLSLIMVRFAARLSGLASGLALAVRPAGLAEVSGAQGWVPKIVSAKRPGTGLALRAAAGAQRCPAAAPVFEQEQCKRDPTLSGIGLVVAQLSSA